MPEALRTRLRLTPDDVLPATDFELNSATDAMSAFEQICLAIPASGAIIAVRDASGLRSVGSLGDAPEVGSHLPPDFGMAIECLENRSPVFRDLTDDAQRVLSVGLSMEGVSQVRSAVTLPMHASGAIIGLIAVFSRHESSIQPRDIKDLTRVADFWGPLMADEWFPEGIPPAIVEEAAANAAANSTVAEAPIVESLPTKGSESAVEKSEIPDEVASAENTAPAQASTEIEPGVSSAIASTVIDSELPSTNAPMEREESIATTAELTGASKLSPSDLSVEALSFARAVGKPTSPIFLAPAEPIPAEAFHSGEPQSFTWFIMLLVFAILLLPVFLLRSHWKQSNAALRDSAAASNPKSVSPAGTPDTNTAPPSPAPAPTAKQPGAPTSDNSSPTSKTLAPDEELPKPLPDLNTPPPTSNPSSASSTPKPTLPAIIKRILKSPNAVAAKPDAPPSAPEITANLQPPASLEPAPPKESVASDKSETAPEPEKPINPAGFQPPNFALAQTLKAHSAWVSSLAFSPAGKLASASWDRTVKLWDLSTSREARPFTGKLKQVQSIAFTRDGKLLAAEDATYTVTIFDASTGQPIRELSTDKSVPSVGISWVYSIAFSPDGRWLASAVDDKTVRIWDVASGTKIRDLSGPRRPVVYVAFSPNGELVATGNDEKSIQIWNVASGAPTSTLTGHKKVINAVAFSPNGTILASASADKTVRLWDAITGKHIRTLSGHQGSVSSISFSPDGRWLASGSWDKTVRIWNVTSGKEVQTLRPDARAIYSVTFDPRSHWLAAGSEDGGIEIWQWNAAATNSNPASPDSQATP
jgi:WD40 repeat protein